MVYSPMSNIGAFLFDKEGDYINIQKNHIVFTERKDEENYIKDNQTVQMMRKIQKGNKTIDNQLENEDLYLIEG